MTNWEQDGQYIFILLNLFELLPGFNTKTALTSESPLSTLKKMHHRDLQVYYYSDSSSAGICPITYLIDF